MRTSLLPVLMILFSGWLFADTWDGSLIDASCYDQKKSVGACYPTNSTVSYALVIERRVFKVDNAGNTKVAQALKQRADRSSNPDMTPNARMTATITGTLDSSDYLRVDSVSVR
ncbi:MAG: hypothetical protein P4L56_14965 [Candidatus Sulfopaludibacter sp.]|nr:hypothetical protein [Candidatus Sulfopaludibacter sp.]